MKESSGGVVRTVKCYELGTSDVERRKELVKVVGTINGVKGVFLVDSGATDQFINVDFAKEAGVVAAGATVQIKLADGTVVESAGAAEAIKFALQCKDGGVMEYTSKFEVMQLQGFDAILGLSWMMQAQPQLVWGRVGYPFEVEVKQRGRNGVLRARRLRVERVGDSEEAVASQQAAAVINVEVTKKKEECIEEEEVKEIPRSKEEQAVYDRLVKEFSDVIPS